VIIWLVDFERVVNSFVCFRVKSEKFENKQTIKLFVGRESRAGVKQKTGEESIEE